MLFIEEIGQKDEVQLSLSINIMINIIINRHKANNKDNNNNQSLPYNLIEEVFHLEGSFIEKGVSFRGEFSFRRVFHFGGCFI